MARDLNRGSRMIRFLLMLALAGGAIGVACGYGVTATATGSVAAQRFALFVMIASVGETVAAAAVLWLLASRKLVARVKVLSAAMDRGAEGDLTATVAVTSDDEIGLLNSNFNTMLERLSGMAGRVNASIDELRQIAGSIREVAAREVTAAKVQSEAVAGTTGAVQEIDHSVNEVARSAAHLSRLGQENSASIQEMSASIEQVLQHVEFLAQAVAEVSASIYQMAVSEKQIGANVNSLMEESLSAASLVAQLDRSITQVEKNALDTAAISEQVRLDAETGRSAVEATISGIREIRHASRTTFTAIGNLSARAADIDKIVAVIDEVAEQTNLLALNASIIAAQAGEHGKGFAVVANEIKELARRTSSSTREIASIIKGVQEETGKAVEAISVAEQRVAEGEELSSRSGSALEKIVTGVAMATRRVDEIAATTVDQSRGSQEMRAAMERVAEMVAQINKATREQGHGNELIMGAVERMKDLTDQVRTSTREQNSSGALIVRATEEITGMIDQIRRATEVQTDSSKQIVAAIEHIDQSTQTSLEATRIMDGAAASLARQIELLQQEMGRFRI